MKKLAVIFTLILIFKLFNAQQTTGFTINKIIVENNFSVCPIKIGSKVNMYKTKGFNEEEIFVIEIGSNKCQYIITKQEKGIEKGRPAKSSNLISMNGKNGYKNQVLGFIDKAKSAGLWMLLDYDNMDYKHMQSVFSLVNDDGSIGTIIVDASLN